MSLTTPDNIFSPDQGQEFKPSGDLQQLAESVQDALSDRANFRVGTSQERLSESNLPEGTHWQDTNEGRFQWVWLNNSWVQVEDEGVQKVLWSDPTGLLLDGSEGEIIELSELISEQKTGVIMVWSRFDSGTPINSNYSYQFIPKAHVNGVVSSGGFGMNQILMEGSTFIRKYVYASDSLIWGLAANATGDNQGAAVRWVVGY